MSRICAPGTLIVAALATVGAGRPDSGWTVYGGGPGQERYSKLTQINRCECRSAGGRLDVGFRRGAAAPRPARLVAGCFTRSPRARRRRAGRRHREAQSGGSSPASRRGANRGVAYWAKAAREARSLRRSGTGSMRWTARPVGRSRASEPRGQDRSARRARPRSGEQSMLLTHAGVVYKDLLIVGGRTSRGASGHARRYPRVRRPQRECGGHSTRFPRPGEFGYKTWPE